MDNIYNVVLLDHHLHPLHRDEKIDANQHFSAINASCGDKLEISYRVDGGVIQEVSFQGTGCAISQASADIMADLLVGKTIAEAQELMADFRTMITTGEKVNELGEANSLCDVSKMPARIKCAELAWTTVDKLVTII